MRAGEVVADRFEIERLAGRGGMGTVWRARDRRSGEPVALKLLTGADVGDRFVREAQLLASLSHPAIVAHVADGTTAAGERWLAMEWLEGEDLGERLRRGRLGVADGVALVARVAEALAAAHARGVVHRDVKPSNVFLQRGELDRVKLLDFGVARAGGGPVVTGTGMMVGTPGYMAPEQARGERRIDARADVYSLGTLLFECVAGRPAFVGENVMAVLAKILLEEPPRLREVAADAPEALEALVARLMAKQREQRPADAAEVARALAGLGVVEPVTPTPRAARAVRALGAAEQRLVGVVAAAPLAEEATAATLAAPAAIAFDRTSTPSGGDAAGDGGDELARLAGSFATRVERLADGSLVASLTATGAATDLAARLARLALSLRQLRPRGAIVATTGQAVVDGRLPIGEVLDRAARLLARAEAGGRDEIELDEITAALLEARFEVVREGGRVLLAGERAEQTDTRLLLGRPTPFVGRERELGTLLAAWDEAIGEPVARALLVTAPAGIGKSRLRHELGRALAGRGERARLWLGRADPMTAGAPLALLADALRRGLELGDADDADERRRRLRARVAELVPAEQAEQVLEFVAELVGAPLADEERPQLAAARRDPMLMGDQLRQAFERLLAGALRDQPLLLLFEDLHWGDEPTVRFVDGALRVLRDRPLMVVAFARPEVKELFPKLWAQRGLIELPLPELGKRASERLVRQVLERADDTTVARLVERAGGNAFYLEELLRAVAQGRGAADQLPATVVAMAQARLEGLDAEARASLRAGSVFGEVFAADGAAALLARPAAALQAQLEGLVEQELLVARGPGEYAFRHAFLRDGAYAMLTDGDRRAGHFAAAQWLSGHAAADPLVVAEHFERGGAPASAVDWYRRAALQSLEANDLAGAIAVVGRGLACGAEGEALIALQMIEMDALLWAGDRGTALEIARRLFEHARRGSRAWCRAAGQVAAATVWSWDVSQLRAIVDAIADATPAADAEVDYLIGACRAATQLCIALKPEEARRLHERVLALAAAREHEPAVRAWVEEHQAFWTAAKDQDLAACIAHFRAAERLYRQAGDRRNAMAQQHNMLFALPEAGLIEEAVQLAETLEVEAESMGLHRMLPTVKLLRAWLAVWRNDHPEALRLMERGKHSFGDDRAHLAYGMSCMARSLLALGRLDEAEVAAREAMTAIGAVRGRGLPRAICAPLAEVLLAQQRPAEALALMESASEEPIGIFGGDVGLARTAATYGRVLLANGRREQAREHVGRAAAELEARIAAISDAELREIYGTIHWYNRELRALARELGV